MGSVRLGVGTEWLLDERMFRVVRCNSALITSSPKN